MVMVKKIGSILWAAFTHLTCLSIVLIFFYPVASWYYNTRPLFGVDFYNTVSLVTILSKNLVFPPAAWLSNWFGGWPYISQYPVLHFYSILPFTFILPVINATLFWVIIASTLNFIGMYFLFGQLSKSKLLSLVLTIGAIYSVGVYGALLWGGGVPSYATQAFYPWVIFFIIKFISSGNRRHFWLACLLSGLAVWGHPQVVIAYIMPTALFILLFVSSAKFSFTNFKRKIGYAFIFALISFFIALPLLYQTFAGSLSRLVVFGGRDSAISTMHVDSRTADVVAFHHAQPWRIYIDTNPIIFVALVVSLIASIIGLLLKPRLKFLARVLPYAFIAILYIIYIRLYADDISILHGGWYRLFWTVPVWLGMLSSVLWGELGEGINMSILKPIAKIVLIPLSVISAITIFVIGGQMPFLTTLPEKKTSPYWTIADVFSTQKLPQQAISLAKLIPFINIEDFIYKLSSEGRAALSSAYPMGINAYPLTDQLKSDLLPNFLKNPETLKYRLYSSDATFNIAWPSYSEIPQGRGYLDPPIPFSERGYLFWLDAALNVDPTRGSSSLVTAFGYPENVAVNHALFLIDWNAIRYLQGGSMSSYPSAINELINNPQYVRTITDVDIASEYPIPIIYQSLKYLELKPELTSPIVSPTNASVVGVVASGSGFETVVRSFAATNMNSQIVIPLNLGKYIDKISDTDLENIDLLIMYDYDYSGTSGFKRINEYIKKGGKVFIDSGVETKQSDNRKLSTPEFFPYEHLERLGRGDKWEFEVGNEDLFNDVVIENFSPPLFDTTEWKQAYSTDEFPRDDVTVWLTNKGKPVLVNRIIEQGEVIWSGLNLFYHVSRYNNLDEGTLLKNILGQVISLEKQDVSQIQVQRDKPRVISITGKNAKGVLIKEQFYSGWQAKIKTSTVNKGIKLYKAGPTFPGFMYLRIPKDILNQQYEITFKFQGSLQMWTFFILTIIMCLVLLDNALLRGIVFGKLGKKIYRFIKTKTGKWWEKDEEDV